MENEIKVGEYCRTKYGYISKVTEIDHYIWFDNIIYKESGIGCYELSKVEFKNIVVKHSHNLIDLIQCGDYVNGEKVIDIAQGKIKAIYTQSQEQKLALIPIVKEQIESVVTKEQFESISYKVERKD